MQGVNVQFIIVIAYYAIRVEVVYVEGDLFASHPLLHRMNQ
jgi:hypothetical protein